MLREVLPAPVRLIRRVMSAEPSHLPLTPPARDGLGSTPDEYPRTSGPRLCRGSRPGVVVPGGGEWRVQITRATELATLESLM
jgi:hypothetical protein